MNDCFNEDYWLSREEAITYLENIPTTNASLIERVESLRSELNAAWLDYQANTAAYYTDPTLPRDHDSYGDSALTIDWDTSNQRVDDLIDSLNTLLPDLCNNINSFLTSNLLRDESTSGYSHQDEMLRQRTTRLKSTYKLFEDNLDFFKTNYIDRLQEHTNAWALSDLLRGSRNKFVDEELVRRFNAWNSEISYLNV